MAKLSKLIQALLHLEKEDPDNRRVVVQTYDRTWSIVRIEETQDEVILKAVLKSGPSDDMAS
jgi:hypothetical protein